MNGPEQYRIRVQGQLSAQWSAWFDGMAVTVMPDGATVLEGIVVDQAALHGILARIRDLGLPLVEVVRVTVDSS